MPTPPAVPNVLKVLWNQDVGADVSVSTRLHFQYSGTAPSDATCLLLAEQFWLACSNYLADMFVPSWSLQSVDVIDMSSSVAGSALYAASSVGTRAGGPLPAACSVLENMHIARRYRGGKPRVYWPAGVAGDLSTPQLWTTGFVTAWEAAYTSFLTDCLGISEGGCVIAGLVSVSLYSGFVSVENPITHRWKNLPTYRTGVIPVDAVLTSSMNPKPGSQRRRNQHST